MANSSESDRNRGSLAYGVVIFLSAFLLFEIQLILGKFFLPWFGGTPATWTTCMCFFQTLLLAGYTYAHLLTSTSPRKQAIFHSVLLLMSLFSLCATAIAFRVPLLPDLSWRPQGSSSPAGHLVVLLSVAVALPYLVLSSTGPLLQSWFTRTNPGETPYRLYALSNFGSLLSLVAYPFLIEPHLTLRTQAWLWSIGFLAFVILCSGRAWNLKQSGGSINAPGLETRLDGAEVQGQRPPSIADHLLWLALALCASVMFLATTNQICQDVAVVPFLWILPLSLYLLSFIISFDQAKWYSRAVFHPAFALSLFLICLVLNGWGLKSLALQVTVYLLTLFVCCMVCHGELARSKPPSKYLTSFYLMVALGGCAGGIFVAAIAPVVFTGFWEYPLALWASALLLIVVLIRDRSSWIYSERMGLLAVALVTAMLPGVTMLATDGTSGLANLFPVIPLLIGVYVMLRWGERGHSNARQRAVPIFGAASIVVLGALLMFLVASKQRGTTWSARNFYGVLTVRELGLSGTDSHAYSLHHGRIAHGFQYRAAARRDIPTAYFGKTSGVGRALLGLHPAEAQQIPAKLSIGVVGLGAGTLAAYGREGDYMRFYEINPQVIGIANDDRYFTFLKDCRARWEVIPGDARISMEHEIESQQPQHFDLLAIDAFSGDAVPVHLLTEEAFAIYLKELKPDGVLAVHITNTYLDLTRALTPIASRYHLKYALLHTSGDNVTTMFSDWVLLSTNASFIDSLIKPEEVSSSKAGVPRNPPWTDDYSNLLGVLRR